MKTKLIMGLLCCLSLNALAAIRTNDFNIMKSQANQLINQVRANPASGSAALATIDALVADAQARGSADQLSQMQRKRNNILNLIPADRRPAMAAPARRPAAGPTKAKLPQEVPPRQVANIFTQIIREAPKDPSDTHALIMEGLYDRMMLYSEGLDNPNNDINNVINILKGQVQALAHQPALSRLNLLTNSNAHKQAHEFLERKFGKAFPFGVGVPEVEKYRMERIYNSLRVLIAEAKKIPTESGAEINNPDGSTHRQSQPWKVQRLVLESIYSAIEEHIASQMIVPDPYLSPLPYTESGLETQMRKIISTANGIKGFLSNKPKITVSAVLRDTDWNAAKKWLGKYNILTIQKTLNLGL